MAKTSKRYELSPEPLTKANGVWVDLNDGFETEDDAPIPQLSSRLRDDGDMDDGPLDLPLPSLSMRSPTGSPSRYSGELIRGAHEEELGKEVSRFFSLSEALNDIISYDLKTIQCDSYGENMNQQDNSIKDHFPNHNRSFYKSYTIEVTKGLTGSSNECLNIHQSSSDSTAISAFNEIAPHQGVQIDEDSLFQFDVPNNKERGSHSVEAQSVFDNDTAGQTNHNSRAGKQQPPCHRVHKKTKQTSRGSTLPIGTIKRLATAFTQSSWKGKGRINKEALGAFTQVSDWFLKQVGEDLEAFAQHAGRETIVETDVMALLKRYVYFGSWTLKHSY